MRAKAEAKYRDPDAPHNTWSGRGKLPRWLQEKMDAGRDRDEFMIGSRDAAPKRRRAKAD